MQKAGSDPSFRVAVFVVDDNELICNAFERLGRDRWNVITEMRGDRAIQILESALDLDVIFLDLLMPKLSGIEIFEHCEKVCPARCDRVVFYSAATDHPTLIPWLKKRNRPMLQKPVSNGAIEQVVEKFARLNLPRGPQFSMPPPPIKKPQPQPSHPELPALYDEEVEVTTGIINVAQTLDIPKEAMQELRIRYMHKTMQTWKPIMDDLEQIKKFMSYFRLRNIVGFIVGMTALIEGIHRLLAHVVFK